jgi:hypothetical protein
MRFILNLLGDCPRFSNFSLFWVSGSPRNAAKGVNTSWSFVESPRMIDNQFSGSPRLFFNNISVSIRQLSILLGDSTNLRERRFGMKRTKIKNSCQKSKELKKNVKTISGSHSGLDASIQAKKQA